MSNETQTFADILVLGMDDTVVIETIERHTKYLLDGVEEHGAIAEQLIVALDNMYGVGSYAKWLRTNVLPSQQ